MAFEDVHPSILSTLALHSNIQHSSEQFYQVDVK
jgi:hypothetical protein